MSGQPRASRPPNNTTPARGGGGGGNTGGRYKPAATDPNAPVVDSKTADVQKKIDSVRVVMKDNMDKTIVRGQQLEEIEQKSDTLLQDANKFEEGARATKQMFCRRNARNIAIISVIAAVFLALIIWWAYPSK